MASQGYRGDVARDRELADTERSVAETALLSAKLLGLGVPIATTGG